MTENQLVYLKQKLHQSLVKNGWCIVFFYRKFYFNELNLNLLFIKEYLLLKFGYDKYGIMQFITSGKIVLFDIIY